MNRILLIIMLALGTVPAYSQITFESLTKSFSGFENEEFSRYLLNNDFSFESLSPDGTSETWYYGNNEENAKSQIVVKKNTFPWNSLWIVFTRHPGYFKIQDEIKRQCEHGGFFGCSEIETWNEYNHETGIVFRLIQMADSEEKGQYIIEVLEK